MNAIDTIWFSKTKSHSAGVPHIIVIKVASGTQISFAVVD